MSPAGTPGGAPVGGSEPGILTVGIDLGTSRTSICASNGVRETIFSCVGYPKDVISRKLLQRDVLFGADAMEHRLSLDFYRPLENGVLKSSEREGDVAEKNLRAARDLLGEAIRQARPRPGDLVYAVVGTPAQASIKNKEAIMAAVEPWVEGMMLCSEPFAVGYGLERLNDVLVVDIGAGTVDLCRLHGTMPNEADQLTLRAAGDHVDQELARRIEELHPDAQFTIQMVKAIKEKHASVAEDMPPARVTLPVHGKPTEFDLTVPIREACRSIIPPIINGLQHLVASFDPEFQSRLKTNVLLAGGVSQCHGLDTALEDAMIEGLGEGRVVRVDEPIYCGAQGALQIASDMPAELWKEMA